MGTLLLSQALEGFELSLNARHLSPHTVSDYERSILKFIEFAGDVPAGQVEARSIQEFLVSQTQLSDKSLLNRYIGLSALWTWMVGEGVVKTHVVHKLKRPKAERKAVEPLTEDEIKAVLSALNKSKTYQRFGLAVDHALGNAERNRAIILLMLDTGLRASELCDLTMGDVDSRNNRVFVKHGKGAKERILPFSARVGQLLWRYMATQRKGVKEADPLFITRGGLPLSRNKLAEMFHRAGERAGVKNFHPHLLRHTFSIQFLRNGGGVLHLQSLLGHSTLDTVKIYVKLAQVDVDEAHRRASPVDNWRL